MRHVLPIPAGIGAATTGGWCRGLVGGPGTTSWRWGVGPDLRGPTSSGLAVPPISPVIHRWPEMPGTRRNRTVAGAGAPRWRCCSARTVSSASPRWGRTSGPDAVVVERGGEFLEEHCQPSRAGYRRRIGFRRCHPGRCRQIPAEHADQQDPGRGEQHQREPLDQRVTTVDQDLLEAGEGTAVKQPVGARYSAEQDQRGLDDGGEHPRLPHHQHRRATAEHIQRGEDVGQVFGTGVERDTGQGRDRGDGYRTPPGQTRHTWMNRATVSWHCRPRLLCCHRSTVPAGVGGGAPRHALRPC